MEKKFETKSKLNQSDNKSSTITRERCLENFKNFLKLEKLTIETLHELGGSCDINLINRLVSCKRAEKLKDSGKSAKDKTYSVMQDAMKSVDTNKIEDIINCMNGMKIDGRMVLLC